MALIDLLSARLPQTFNLYLKRNEVAVKQNKGKHTKVKPASILPHLWHQCLYTRTLIWKMCRMYLK